MSGSIPRRIAATLSLSALTSTWSEATKIVRKANMAETPRCLRIVVAAWIIGPIWLLRENRPAAKHLNPGGCPGKPPLRAGRPDSAGKLTEPPRFAVAGFALFRRAGFVTG